MRKGLVWSITVVLLALAGCGSPSSSVAAPQSSATVSSPLTEPPTTTTTALTGHLRITQHQTSCCYTEGQVSFLTVRDASGLEVANREFNAIDPILPVVDLWLSIGSYNVDSYQRPCDGNCGSLDAVTDQCNVQIDVAAGAKVFLTASFAPGEGCSIAQTETALRSPVPDLFAFREPYEDCGLDFSLEMVGDVPGQGRTCFAEANAGGRAAELSAYQAGATPGPPDFIVYRTNADRSVEVFLPNLGRESDGPWRHYVCSGLRPDATQGFALDGCTDPIEIDP